MVLPVDAPLSCSIRRHPTCQVGQPPLLLEVGILVCLADPMVWALSIQAWVSGAQSLQVQAIMQNVQAVQLQRAGHFSQAQLDSGISGTLGWH